jgi:hypothetical protein
MKGLRSASYRRTITIVWMMIVPWATAIVVTAAAAATAAAITIGQAVQSARTEGQLLTVADTFWLPTDDNLAPHLRHQIVHHEKRQRWAAQLLDKLPQVSDWSAPALARAVQAASIPFEDHEHTDRVTVEGQSIALALQGIHRLMGRRTRSIGHDCATTTSAMSLSKEAVEGILQLISRAEALGDDYELPDALSTRWACRGILRRLQDNDGRGNTTTTATTPFALPSLPKLDARASRVPFDIHPLGVDFGDDDDDDQVSNNIKILQQLQDVIPFQIDTIVTRTGAAVPERRATAWLAQDGIGALAYSGKLMPPQRLSPLVRDIMRQVERVIGVVVDDDIITDDTVPYYFDCALCNYYPDAAAACKFHTDPEHGTLWERLTCVVSVGDDRRFAFRPITTWGEEGCDHDRPAVVDLFPGDIVQMDENCNDDYLHAVYAARDNGDHDDPAPIGRISLVLKRAIARAGGRRGHGLQGQGRRRTKQQQRR